MPRKRRSSPESSLVSGISQKRTRTDSDDSNDSGKEECSQADSGYLGRAGVVLKMVLRNFMCHDLLEVEFKPSINYIIGRNGSGKSAILTALIVGLGGRATLTDRGSSIKGFIKAGKQSSTVEIVLRNEGDSRFDYQTYGKRITVVRNFTAAGSSSYKIKNARGETVSSSAREVQRICMSLNVQVDNPVCLLNQDTSRNFLNTKDPAQKFILFMRATQLERLYECWKSSHRNEKNTLNLLNQWEDMYKELKAEIKAIKKNMDDHKSIFAKKENVKQLHAEVLWAKVRDTEEDLNHKQIALTEIDNEKSAMLDIISNGDNQLTAIQDNIKSLENQVDELQKSVRQQLEPQDALKSKINNVRELINTKTREKNALQNDIAKKTSDCGILEQEIQQFSATMASREEEKVKRLKQMVDLEGKLKSIQALCETSRNDSYQMQEAQRRMNEESSRLTGEIENIDQSIGETKDRLSSFQGASNDALMVYGREMRKIVQEIQAHKDKFVHVPRGPLGSYITLRDKQWAVAVEGTVGIGLLRAFTVDNKKDNVLLQNIFQTCCGSNNKPMTITGKFFDKVHDVSRYVVQEPSGCVSIFNALQFSDPVVANCLIDQLGIESTLLIPDTNTAIRLLSESSRVPHNCKKGITAKGDTFFPDPNYKTYASRYKVAQFLQVSHKELVNNLQQKLENLRSKRQAIQQEHNIIHKELEKHMSETKALALKIEKLNRAQAIAQSQINNYKNTAEPEVANVHELESEYQDLKKLLRVAKCRLDEVEKEIASTESKVLESEEQFSENRRICRGYQERIAPLQLEIDEEKARRREIGISKTFSEKNLAACEAKLEKAQNALQSVQENIETYTREAEDRGERPPTLRAVREIVEEIEKVEQSIRFIESELEKPEQLAEKYKDRTTRYEEARRVLTNMHDDYKLLAHMTKKHKRYYKKTEDFSITLVKDSFKRMLEKRQFKGHVEINLKDRKLDLIVKPQHGTQGFTATANLSGGERSFSTVAFLYALWQCMKFPFYFLDEFDVFMDKVNRTKVMDILLSHAKNNPELQYVFLTPQDISFIHDDSVAIHRLENPERRNT